eukprot:CAMPEP_0180456598 /NCGR_PEP_ID=MMETSP1036_2-20121128/21388_1 /TAXON_ID=632150 /ORGANISM="Azadinium spinosum, Strain 3D9" /LENGTH=33 /DNA_ID= /DNA_START= /DNA_END= /DNA_ORIENTATION=
MTCACATITLGNGARVLNHGTWAQAVVALSSQH